MRKVLLSVHTNVVTPSLIVSLIMKASACVRPFSRDTMIQTTCGVYLRIGSTAQRNSKVPTVVPASKGVKLKYVLGEIMVMSKSSASERI